MVFEFCSSLISVFIWFVFFFQAEDGIRDLVRSRGLGDVYKRQVLSGLAPGRENFTAPLSVTTARNAVACCSGVPHHCLLYTSDAADERSSVDLGGRRIIKKKKYMQTR